MNNIDKIQTWEFKAQPLSCIRRNHFAMKVKKLSAAVKTANDCIAVLRLACRSSLRRNLKCLQRDKNRVKQVIILQILQDLTSAGHDYHILITEKLLQTHTKMKKSFQKAALAVFLQKCASERSQSANSHCWQHFEMDFKLYIANKNHVSELHLSKIHLFVFNLIQLFPQIVKFLHFQIVKCNWESLF